MKKIIAICLLFAAIQSTWAINAKQVFNEFKEARNAEYISVPRFLIKLGQVFVNKDKDEDEEGSAEVKRLMHSVHSIKVLDLEKCSNSVKQKFTKRINALNTEQYETLVRVNDEDDKVKILVREEKETIKELLIVCSGAEDCVLIQFKGDFKESDIDALVKQAENKGKK